MSWCTCCHYLCQAIVYDFLQGRYNYTEQRGAERQRNVRGGVCSLHILANVKKGDHSHTQSEMFMNYSRRLLLLSDHLLSCGTGFSFSFVEKVRNLHVLWVENVFSVETTARSEMRHRQTIYMLQGWRRRSAMSSDKRKTYWERKVCETWQLFHWKIILLYWKLKMIQFPVLLYII